MVDRKVTRRKLPALALISMLGLAVFLWGLHYKLSLYQTHLTAHNAPAAKLLSQKERASCSPRMTTVILPNARSPRAGTKFQSGTSLAPLTSSGRCIAGEWKTLLIAPGLQPEPPLGRSFSPGSPRAPPLAI